jgi:hypothetical protein
MLEQQLEQDKKPAMTTRWERRKIWFGLTGEEKAEYKERAGFEEPVPTMANKLKSRVRPRH